MKFLAILATFCLFSWVSSETPAPKSVQQKFLDDEIVPDVLKSIAEVKKLNVVYPSGVKAELGNVLTPTKVKNEPEITYDAEDGAFYTLLLTDPDAPSRKEPIRREFRHWLIVNIPGDDIKKGETVFQYIGSGPPKDTGLHRYVFLLFQQPEGKIEFDSPYVSDHSSLGRPSTNTTELVEKYKLKLVAGNFYQAQYDDYVPTLHAQLAGKKLNE